MHTHRSARRANVSLGLLAAVISLAACLGWSKLAGPASAACTPLASNKGQVSSTFTITTPGVYTLWLRLNTPDTNRNSVFVQVDDQCPVVAGDAQSGGYEWVDYQGGDRTQLLSYTLSAGQHTLKIAGHETGAGADKVMFLADNCVPTGMGTNCPASAKTDAKNTLIGPRGAVASMATGRNWWLLGGSIIASMALCGALVWKYMSFVKVTQVTPDHNQIVVGTGLPTHTDHWAMLRAFLQHHRSLVLLCGSGIVALAIVGVVAAATTLPFFEVEAGSLSGATAVISDSAASGGKYVLFGADPATVQSAQAAASGSGGSSTQSGGGGGSGSSGGGGGGGGSTSQNLNLPRIPWEGGPSYYAGFPKATAWNNPSFFPIGVWYESVLTSSDTSKDVAAGLNTYVELTDNSDTSLIRSAGMYSFPSGTLAGYGSEDTGWMIADEADMNYGPGNDGWDQNYNDTVSTWDSCIPTQDNGGKCGYTAMSTLKGELPQGDGRLFYANYGKGVMMWDSDTEAAQFVNNYTNVTSADMYFYTDPNLCSGESQTWLGIPSNQCRMSANYGFVIDRLRTLDAMDGKRQPIFSFVEDGCPFSNGGCISANQIAGAVMSSLIHEARGIIYFNHNFGSSCISQHVLRDSCGTAIRPTVTAVNSMIKDLAPVLNTQSYQYSFNGSLDTMLKGLNGTYYIFAMQKRPNTSGSYTFTLPSGLNASSVQLPYEGNRTIPVSGGKFTDSFAAEYSYHVYKVIP